MKVFVTGGTGFIGLKLIRRLMNRGIEVVALVRKKEYRLPFGVETIQGDILDTDTYVNACRGCSRLYHLAGEIDFDPAKRKRLLKVNGEGTTRVLSVARASKIERSVVVSSACTMGLSYNEKQVLNEETPLSVELARKNPYLESKLAAERTAMDASAYQWVAVVNPTTVYGEGDWRLNSGTLIQKISSTPIAPVPSGGGNVVDVGDVAEGIISAGENGRNGQRYILGGVNMKFAEIFAVIAEVVGHRPYWIPLHGWLKGPLGLAAQIGGKISGNRFMTAQIVRDMFAFKFYSTLLAESELGWLPEVPFRDSVEQAWRFYQKERLFP